MTGNMKIAYKIGLKIILSNRYIVTMTQLEFYMSVFSGICNTTTLGGATPIWWLWITLLILTGQQYHKQFLVRISRFFKTMKDEVNGHFHENNPVLTAKKKRSSNFGLV